MIKMQRTQVGPVQSSPAQSTPSSSVPPQLQKGKETQKNEKKWYKVPPLPSSVRSKSQDRTSPSLPFFPPTPARAVTSSARRITSMHHQLSRQVHEHLVNVEASPRGGFVERYTAPLT